MRWHTQPVRVAASGLLCLRRYACSRRPDNLASIQARPGTRKHRGGIRPPGLDAATVAGQCSMGVPSGNSLPPVVWKNEPSQM